jgi:GDP-mannose transporter
MVAEELNVEVIRAILLYCVCSGTMLIVNKLTVSLIPMPSLVTSIQLSLCLCTVTALKAMKIIDCDDYEWSKVKPYLYYIIAFAGSVFCNMKALSVSNVETIIVFRTSAPLFVAVLDWLFLGRTLPSIRSTSALLLIIAGAASYVTFDKEFALHGFSAYTWAIAYLLLICFEMTYGKYIISTVKMKDKVWGAVLYTNTFAILPTLFLGFGCFGEAEVWGTFEWTPSALAALLVSSLIGISISYAGFNCRDKISATSFTVVGVMNKLLTITINVSMWDKHASAGGLASLGVCLVGGMLYKQAPLRKEGPSFPQETPTKFIKGFADFAVNGEDAEALVDGEEADREEAIGLVHLNAKSNQVTC